MPSKAQQKRKINKADYQKRVNQDLTPTSSTAPISKRPRLSATENPASDQPSTSSSSATQGCGQSSAEKNHSDSEEHSDSDDSLTKKKQGKSAKRKFNKHNGRKGKNVGQQSDSNDESEAESSSDHSDSDESLPENEEFQVVMDSESILRPGYFSAKICIRILYIGRCLRQWLFLQF